MPFGGKYVKGMERSRKSSGHLRMTNLQGEFGGAVFLRQPLRPPRTPNRENFRGEEEKCAKGKKKHPKQKSLHPGNLGFRRKGQKRNAPRAVFRWRRERLRPGGRPRPKRKGVKVVKRGTGERKVHRHKLIGMRLQQIESITGKCGQRGGGASC